MGALISINIFYRGYSICLLVLAGGGYERDQVIV